jgi:exodeoxyribonuclease-5
MASCSTVTLSAEQRRALTFLLASRNEVTTLGGLADSGKTVLVAALKEALPSYQVCAFAGKAADVLRRRGLRASTIHSLIYTPQELRGHVYWELKEPREVPGNGFIVDEASMIGKTLHQDLLSFGRPIFYLGDHAQLPPVSDSDFNLMSDPDFKLEEVHRHAGEIKHFANWLRQGGTAKKWLREKSATGAQVQIVEEADLNPADINQIICGYNATRVRENQRFRACLGYPEDRPVPGDRVICKQNCNVMFNGQQATLAGIQGNILTVRVEVNGRTVRHHIPCALETFNCERLPERRLLKGRVPFDYAYCITAHSAQGSEWDHVLVLEEHSRLWSSARWAYTAASRAIQQLTWVRAG